MVSRATEQFREDMHHDWSYDDLRIMPAAMVQRWVDPEVANRLRMGIYHQQRRAIDRMTTRSGSDNDMEKLRGKQGRYRSGALSDYALSDNIAAIYFSYYGENFEGGDVVDNPEDGYTCPWCKLKYGMSLKAMPDNCMRCGSITPLGRLKKDGAFNR